jgi:hypothetical protein
LKPLLLIIFWNEVSYDKRLEKDIIAPKFVRFGLYPLLLFLSFINPNYGQVCKVWLWSPRSSSLDKTTREVQFYLTSLNSNAQLIGRAIRKHWGIENEAHWTLDCTFAEDACRIRSFHSPENFALLRRIALNALNREQTYDVVSAKK